MAMCIQYRKNSMRASHKSKNCKRRKTCRANISTDKQPIRRITGLEAGTYHKRKKYFRRKRELKVRGRRKI